MLVSTILAWLLGIALGTLTGYFADKTWAKILDAVIMCIYPIPNYIMALMLLFLLPTPSRSFPSAEQRALGSARIQSGLHRQCAEARLPTGTLHDSHHHRLEVHQSAGIGDQRHR